MDMPFPQDIRSVAWSQVNLQEACVLYAANTVLYWKDVSMITGNS
jgi:hypothetical protein